jgi:hypothetical protein
MRGRHKDHQLISPASVDPLSWVTFEGAIAPRGDPERELIAVGPFYGVLTEQVPTCHCVYREG